MSSTDLTTLEPLALIDPSAVPDDHLRRHAELVKTRSESIGLQSSSHKGIRAMSAVAAYAVLLGLWAIFQVNWLQMGGVVIVLGLLHVFTQSFRSDYRRADRMLQEAEACLTPELATVAETEGATRQALIVWNERADLWNHGRDIFSKMAAYQGSEEGTREIERMRRDLEQARETLQARSKDLLKATKLLQCRAPLPMAKALPSPADPKKP